jgi:hypothetical protein
MSPVDAIRADLQLVRSVLDEQRAVAPSAEDAGEQLGLF